MLLRQIVIMRGNSWQVREMTDHAKVKAFIYPLMLLLWIAQGQLITMVTYYAVIHNQ